jgi:hypothetical protein
LAGILRYRCGKSRSFRAPPAATCFVKQRNCELRREGETEAQPPLSAPLPKSLGTVILRLACPTCSSQHIHPASPRGPSRKRLWQGRG